MIDVYKVISETSCAVQQVEQFPFEMRAKLAAGISKLRHIANSLNIEDPDPDSAVWPTLKKNLEELENGKFHTVELKEKLLRKLTRSQDDIGDLDAFKTVQNRLASLARYQAKIIERRTINNVDHPYPGILDDMAECLD